MLSKIEAGIVLLIVALVVMGAMLMPLYEAREFNRCTGGHATYLTAVTTELRVEKCND